MPALGIKNLSKRFGRTEVMRDVFGRVGEDCQIFGVELSWEVDDDTCYSYLFASQ